MNIFFLVEGKTEALVYPEWLSYLAPQLNRVDSFYEATQNSYYVFNSRGFPSILNFLEKTIEDINEIQLYDYLVLCLDAEEDTVEIRKQKIFDFLEEKKLQLNPFTSLVLIIQNPCFETWSLGNRKIFKRNTDNEKLIKYIEFYNIAEKCPENMGRFDGFETRAQFHEAYLRELFFARNSTYSKTKPHEIQKKSYLEELQKRIQETNDLASLQSFLDFCKKIYD
jgi:hypothetical protein